MEARHVPQPAVQRHSEKIEAIMDPATGWLHGWYFDLRLEEELARSRRYGYPVSLLVILLPEEPGDDEAHDFRQRIAAIAHNRLRRPDLPAVLGPRELAICLPHTDKSGAGMVAHRVEQAADVGVEPLDHGVDLLVAARQPLHASEARDLGVVDLLAGVRVRQEGGDAGQEVCCLSTSRHTPRRWQRVGQA